MFQFRLVLTNTVRSNKVSFIEHKLHHSAFENVKTVPELRLALCTCAHIAYIPRVDVAHYITGDLTHLKTNNHRHKIVRPSLLLDKHVTALSSQHQLLFSHWDNYATSASRSIVTLVQAFIVSHIGYSLGVLASALKMTGKLQRVLKAVNMLRVVSDSGK